MPQTALSYTDKDDERMHGRMINWGRVMRDRYNGNGYPSSVSFMTFPSKCETADELDAEKIEEVMAAFRVGNIGLSAVHAFLAKIEYLERDEARMNTASERAADVRRKYNMPCSERTYYRLLWQARKAIWHFL